VVCFGTRPADARHPVITDHGHPDPATVPDEPFEALDVLVATVEPESDPIGDRDRALHDRELEPGIGQPAVEPLEVVVTPVRSPVADFDGMDDCVPNAHLSREMPAFVRIGRDDQRGLDHTLGCVRRY
jgi:hypothetical protein